MNHTSVASFEEWLSTEERFYGTFSGSNQKLYEIKSSILKMSAIDAFEAHRWRDMILFGLRLSHLRQEYDSQDMYHGRPLSILLDQAFRRDPEGIMHLFSEPSIREDMRQQHHKLLLSGRYIFYFTYNEHLERLEHLRTIVADVNSCVSSKTEVIRKNASEFRETVLWLFEVVLRNFAPHQFLLQLIDYINVALNAPVVLAARTELLGFLSLWSKLTTPPHDRFVTDLLASNSLEYWLLFEDRIAKSLAVAPSLAILDHIFDRKKLCLFELY